MDFLIAFLATGCPNCDGPIVKERHGYACEDCSVLVSTRVCGWRFPAESTYRPMPGLLGRFFRKPEAAA